MPPSEPSRPFVAPVLSWWHQLQDDPKARAELRRCARPEEVAFTPAFHRLRLALRGTERAPRDETLAVVAGVLGQVRANSPATPPHVAAQLASSVGGRALMSGLRFRRLLAVQPGAELMTAMVRAVRLLGDRGVHLGSLIPSLVYWNDLTRKEWATRYYEIALNES